MKGRLYALLHLGSHIGRIAVDTGHGGAGIKIDRALWAPLAKHFGQQQKMWTFI